MTTFLILSGLVIVLLTGVPIFAGLGVTSIILMLFAEGSIGSIADTVFGKLDTGLLTAIPMFAFMAHVMIRSKVVDDLFDAANAMVPHLPGGLGVGTVLSCTVFAAISGSSVATALTIGSSAIPQMQRYGYRPSDSYGSRGWGNIGHLNSSLWPSYLVRSRHGNFDWSFVFSGRDSGFNPCINFFFILRYSGCDAERC